MLFYFMPSFCLCSFPVWCLGQDVEFDCIGGCSLPFHLFHIAWYSWDVFPHICCPTLHKHMEIVPFPCGVVSFVQYKKVIIELINPGSAKIIRRTKPKTKRSETIKTNERMNERTNEQTNKKNKTKQNKKNNRKAMHTNKRTNASEVY